jgi:hypothetical protein
LLVLPQNYYNFVAELFILYNSFDN